MRYLLLFTLCFFTACSRNYYDSEETSVPSEGILFFKEYEDPLPILNIDEQVVFGGYYSLAKRKIEYDCVLSENDIVEFSTSEKGIKCVIDVKNKVAQIGDNKYNISISGGRRVIISFEKYYQKQIIRVCEDNKIDSIELINDGEGGIGKGSINDKASIVPMPHGVYAITLLEGEGMLLNRVRITTPSTKYYLIMYGDSITETESYYPVCLFPYSWPQLIIKRIPNSITSAVSGGKVSSLLNRMKSELPYLDVKYVMVTIGTNGGNSVDNFTDIIEYIKSLGMIPILNHIPCNESQTQIENNAIIDTVRLKFMISGADFDLATSLNNDGKELDKSTMFWEDYSSDYSFFGHDYWHHPNVKGSEAMYEQILTDLPWIVNCEI